MLRAIRLIAFILLAGLQQQYGIAQNPFTIHIGTEINDFITSADNDDFGNTVFVGISSTSTMTQPAYSRIIKVYADGSYINKDFALPDSIYGMSYIKVLSNGNYFVVSGKTKFPNPNNTEQCLMEIRIYDSALNLLTRKSYSLPNSTKNYNDVGSECSLVEDNEGNLVLATSLAYDPPTNFHDFVFYKFNLEGDTLASRVYETWYDAFPYRLTKVPGTDLLMLIGNGYIPFWGGELMFLNADLSLNHVKRIRHQVSGEPDSKKWLGNTRFMIVMDSTQPYMHDERMTRIGIMDTTGRFIKSIAINHPDTIEYVAQYEGMSYFNDTLIYISCEQSYNNLSVNVPNEVFLYMIDTALNIRGFKRLGDGNYYFVHGTQAAPDGGCFIWAVRWKIPYDGNWGDIIIWKVMPGEMTLCTGVVQLPEAEIAGHAWPNPANDVINISLEAFIPGETLQYLITDAKGRTCLDMKQTVTGNCLQTQIHNLEPGVYMYKLTGKDNKTITGKFIKNKKNT